MSEIIEDRVPKTTTNKLCDITSEVNTNNKQYLCKIFNKDTDKELFASGDHPHSEWCDCKTHIIEHTPT